MKIQIKATNIEPTPSIREYVEKKLHSLEKFIQAAPETVLAEVEVGMTTSHHKTGNIFRAELNLRMDGRKIYIQEEMEDLYAAIDAMRDTAERECISTKDKQTTLAKRGAAKLKNMLRWS